MTTLDEYDSTHTFTAKQSAPSHVVRKRGGSVLTPSGRFVIWKGPAAPCGFWNIMPTPLGVPLGLGFLAEASLSAPKLVPSI